VRPKPEGSATATIDGKPITGGGRKYHSSPQYEALVPILRPRGGITLTRSTAEKSPSMA